MDVGGEGDYSFADLYVCFSVRKMCGLVQRAGHCAIDRGYTEDRETAVITSHYQSQVAV